MYKLLLVFLLPWMMIQAGPDEFDLKVQGDKLIYLQDEQGNQVLDFSYCGYQRSEQALPDVPVKLYIQSQNGDMTSVLQLAIDKVSSLKPDVNGFRGAILLKDGTYKLSESLFVRQSGVVLRGSGTGETILLKTGTSRSPFIRVEGKENMNQSEDLNVEDEYIPVGSKNVHLSKASNLKAGDRIIVYRPSKMEWIKSLKCDVFGGNLGYWGWKEGDADLRWDREVLSVNGNSILLDAPLTMALKASEGKPSVYSYHWSGRINRVGIENLSMVSAFDTSNLKDEDHAWTGISMENTENSWVRKVDFKNLAGSAVILQSHASRITVEDCIALNPISEIGGLRRDVFLNFGQLNLFQRCYSEKGMHDFALGYGAPGPNAFVQCESYMSNDFSGPTDTWAPGVLYDLVNIDGNDLVFRNLGVKHQGAGWNTGNSLLWQCTASGIELFTPNQENKNRSYACWSVFNGDGQWAEANNHVHPYSLFEAQLKTRTRKDVSAQCRVLEDTSSENSSPTLEEAAISTALAKLPKLTLRQWIQDAPFTADIHFKPELAFHASEKVQAASKPRANIEFVDGKLVKDGILMTGNKTDVPWWNGKLRPQNIAKAKIAVTRFVPGRSGLGLTDDLDSVIHCMNQENILVLDQHYSLWYDRRRDDHERIRRKDGDVWGPFLEQAFARYGGIETAWDGLSKYDLNKPNKWYWYRLKQFADKAEPSGRLMFAQHFFQHNIIEAGAHYVDSPWRTANNVNDMGLPEPVNFAGDKRIFYAEMFYDLTYPGRKAAFRNYIRTCLDAFKENENVIHSISDEYTGPLHFVQFWFDVIEEWQKENGRDLKIALSVTKDVQDSILNDTQRASLVDLIDIRYWHPRLNDVDYAPLGGKNMAPRQFTRKMKVGKTSYDDAYRAVREYRERYPDKAVTFYAQNYPDLAWAVFMAGGSCPVLINMNEDFLKHAATMHPGTVKIGQYEELVNFDTGNIIFSHQDQQITLAVKSGNYNISYLNPQNGDIKIINKKVKIDSSYTFNIKSGVYWLRKL